MKNFPGPDARPAGYAADRYNLLKKVYTESRRLLESFNRGDSNYRPASSLDGKSYGESPEIQQVQNVWESQLQKLEALNREPCLYVRQLFYFLRGSTIPIPTPNQLSSERYLSRHAEELEIFFKEESSRVKSACDRLQTETLLKVSCGETVPVALFKVCLSNQLGWSPLFAYTAMYVEAEKARKSDKKSFELMLKGMGKLRVFALNDLAAFYPEFLEIYQENLDPGLKSEALEVRKF
jgi:hypothetical protein